MTLDNKQCATLPKTFIKDEEVMQDDVKTISNTPGIILVLLCQKKNRKNKVLLSRHKTYSLQRKTDY